MLCENSFQLNKYIEEHIFMKNLLHKAYGY